MKKTLWTMLSICLIATIGCSEAPPSKKSASNSKAKSASKGSTAVAETPAAPPATITGKLVVGEVAPEIEGYDTDGEPFKLSDYRGKVVMLDFWGDW